MTEHHINVCRNKNIDSTPPPPPNPRRVSRLWLRHEYCLTELLHHEGSNSGLYQVKSRSNESCYNEFSVTSYYIVRCWSRKLLWWIIISREFCYISELLCLKGYYNELLRQKSYYSVEVATMSYYVRRVTIVWRLLRESITWLGLLEGGVTLVVLLQRVGLL